ncbi:MAG TPA: GGDEF domain-containing protein [Acetobacteraceae bacterium]|nr:GGDEF domain-containing protein [Acetobacteraceae bacterium]HQT78797.1 GGDEF domain-containing protein [Rhodopila sp.]
MTCIEAYDSSIVAVLEEIRATATLEGLAVLDLAAEADESVVMYSVGVAGPTTIATGRLLMTGQRGRPTHLVGQDGRPVLACPWVMAPGRPGGLLLWRSPRSPGWTQTDYGLAASVALMVRMTIGTAAGYSGIDHLTGVPNRRWFLDEADRRAERLDHDGAVASLLLIDVDNLKQLNASQGRELGDQLLVRVASQIRATVRPGDLVARVGPDEFAVWHDGMDHLTAAERADALCNGRLFHGSPEHPRVSLSIGIVSRAPGASDDVRGLLRRAYMAARDVKARGGSGWRVAQPSSQPGCSDAAE